MTPCSFAFMAYNEKTLIFFYLFMILAKSAIFEEIKKGNIKISPYYEEYVGPASVDLHLGTTFRRFKHHNEVFDVTEDSDFEQITEVAEVGKDGSLLLKQGETVLGITRERITLSKGLCGWIEGRSRFARIGLGVHITSGFAHPGIDNHQVLEITNLSPTPLMLYPGVRICQFVFQRCEGEGSYRGKFQGQDRP